MLAHAIVFLIIALIVGASGFFGVAGLTADIAKTLFLIFAALFVASLFVDARRVRRR